MERAVSPAVDLVENDSVASRIVHVSDYAPDTANGVERAVYHLAEAQRALGYDVAVVGSDEHGGGRPRTLLNVARAGAVRGPLPPWLARILACRPDVVHFHSIHVPEHVWIASRIHRAGVPYLVTPHGGLSAVASHGRLSKMLFRHVCESTYLNRASAVHALTSAEADDIRRYGATVPIVVAPNGIDIESLPRATTSRAFDALGSAFRTGRVFAFIGRLDPFKKGLDLLIRALARARAPTAVLVLVGPDWRDQRRNLVALASQLGVRSRVAFLGPMPPSSCADVLASADVFVHSSRSEGVSMAVLEAAARARACLLTTPADPDGDLQRGGGSITVPPMVQALADAIEWYAATSADTLRAMGERAQATVQARFTWPRSARIICSTYDDVVAARVVACPH